MCQRLYFKCSNYACDGIAQRLALIPCENRPDCDLVYVRRPRPRQATGNPYCTNCRQLTARQRRNQVVRENNARKKANAKSTKSQEGENHGAEVSAPTIALEAGSSAMGESGGAIGGGFPPYYDPEGRGAIDDGFLPYSEFPFPTPDDADPFFFPAEYSFTGSDMVIHSQNEQRTGPVSDSDEPLDDPANEDDSSMSSFPTVTHGPQITDPGTVTPIASDLPSNAAMDSFLARPSTPTNVPGTPHQEHEQRERPLPTLQETIDWLNAQPDITDTLEAASLPRDSATGPDTLNRNEEKEA